MLISLSYVLLCLGLVVACIRPLGRYMAHVYSGERTFLTPVVGGLETLIYRSCGIAPKEETGWRGYALGVLFIGLFGFVLKKSYPQEKLAAMLDHLDYFGMGYSWGGFESLLIPTSPKRIRTATKWPYEGQSLRIHVGLEKPEDLIKDLEHGFERLAK